MTTYNETVTEDVDVLAKRGEAINFIESLTTDDFNLVEWPKIVIEDFTIDDTPVPSIIAQIVELIQVLDLPTTNGTFLGPLEDSFVISDIIAVAYPIIVIDDLTNNDSIIDVQKKIEFILELLNLSDIDTTQATINVGVAVALTLADIVKQIEPVSEDITLNDTFIDLLIMAQQVVEDIESSLSDATYISMFQVVEEEGSVTDTISNTASLLAALEEDFIITTSDMLLDGVYSGWVINPENYAVSNYNNFDFTTSVQLDNEYLFGNSSGLYELGGDLDETAYIQARIKTAAMTFGSTNMKQVPEIFLGTNNSGIVILKVSVDDNTTALYELKATTQGLATQMIKTGKGLYGRWWQFELITKENSTFDLDTFEMFPIQFGRKLR